MTDSCNSGSRRLGVSDNLGNVHVPFKFRAIEWEQSKKKGDVMKGDDVCARHKPVCRNLTASK